MPSFPNWTLIAAALDMQPDCFAHKAINNDLFFRPTAKKYVKGKKRELDRPYRPHKNFLRTLNRHLNKLVPVHSNAHCGVPNKSRFKAVRKHLGRKAYLTRDFSDCYPNISQADLLTELTNYCPDLQTAEILSRLLTVRGKLAQGSPVSAFALNIYLYRMDEFITERVQLMGGRYTRYGDDLLISLSDDEKIEDASKLLHTATRTFTKLSFNNKKLVQKGLQRADKEVLMLGLDIRSAMGPRIPTATQKSALDKAQKYIRSAQSVNWDSIESIARIRRSVMGVICDFRQAQQSNARALESLLIIGDRIVQRKLSKLGLAPCKHKWWVKRKRKNEPKRLAMAWRKLCIPLSVRDAA